MLTNGSTTVLRRKLWLAVTLSLWVTAVSAQAQEVIGTRDRVDFESPEGWAMAHTTAATLNLGQSPTRETATGTLRISAEMGSIPHIDREDRRVGFGGFKQEDLNKSPVFARGRLYIGLPADFTAELSWTPPIRVNGSRAEMLYGLALERNLHHYGPWSLGGRAFLVRGDATGDITCSRSVAAQPAGSDANPFGCQEASEDRIRLDHEGVELTGSYSFPDRPWQPYIAMAITRMTPHVQVDARVFDVRDRSQLEAKGQTTTLSLGTVYTLSPAWEVTGAASYTPLDVARPPDHRPRSHDFWSIRLGLQWHGPPSN